MKVNSVIDVAGAIVMLAMLAVVATHPKIVTDVTGGFVNSINAARKG